ncbi:Bug family tripartite tricarboxylate transporter substrate binding protein [Neoroseomonas soli]|uniref:Tripartite tricarboxylate transporter substrate binding protein n=1 Tax=Neoroseomonas soli TaxID=1081025 RepID=A0A9X9WR42_9PROT|nr:tripartite tricarboxylate transporter substrate binding protein [Neoroseomonas soli]MBR0669621.1 tripartite tricarboxylate transporter substrate binding protein [Neoroseomonas soli]
MNDNDRLGLPRRTLLAAGVAILGAPAVARAQSWPDRGVRIIVPFPPGGAIDAMTRLIAPPIERAIGQPVVVENRSGAGGLLGTEAASQARDGHTLLMTALTHVVLAALNPRLPYDPYGDFLPVAPVGTVANVLVVPASSPYRSVADLVAAARRQPGRLTYGSAGSGTSLHLCAALFCARSGIEMTHVPYRGSGPAVTDLVAGRLDAMFDSATSVAPHVAAGKLRALAVTTSRRSALQPDLPTIAEAGVPGYAVDWWYAMLAPRGMPEEGRRKVGAAVHEALKQAELRERFAAIRCEPMEGDADALGAIIGRDRATWTAVIQQLGLQAQ